MNAALQIGSAAPAALSENLFNSFITFIDRSEKTTATYITNLRQFMAWLKFRAIVQPMREDVIAYRDYLSTEHEAIKLDAAAPAGWSYRTDRSGNRFTLICKPGTVAQYLRSVCSFFRWTAANNYYPDIAANIHAPKIKHDIHKKEALSASDVLKIEQHIKAAAEIRSADARNARKDSSGKLIRYEEQGKRLYAMYVLAVNAGLRTIELSRANIRDIEIKNGSAWIYIWGKGHTEADTRKPLAPEVYTAIKEYLDRRTDAPTGKSPLFVATGNRSGGKRLAARTISQMLKRGMIEAGYNSERITAHSLRHTAGTAVMELTGNIYATQQYMRHANPATTEIYLHNDTERQETKIAQALYNMYHATTLKEKP